MQLYAISSVSTASVEVQNAMLRPALAAAVRVWPDIKVASKAPNNDMRSVARKSKPAPATTHRARFSLVRSAEGPSCAGVKFNRHMQGTVGKLRIAQRLRLLH